MRFGAEACNPKFQNHHVILVSFQQSLELGISKTMIMVLSSWASLLTISVYIFLESNNQKLKIFNRNQRPRPTHGHGDGHGQGPISLETLSILKSVHPVFSSLVSCLLLWYGSLTSQHLWFWSLLIYYILNPLLYILYISIAYRYHQSSRPFQTTESSHLPHL